jgi:hypothetical protein
VGGKLEYVQLAADAECDGPVFVLCVTLVCGGRSLCAAYVKVACLVSLVSPRPAPEHLFTRSLLSEVY